MNSKLAWPIPQDEAENVRHWFAVRLVPPPAVTIQSFDSDKVESYDYIPTRVIQRRGRQRCVVSGRSGVPSGGGVAYLGSGGGHGIVVGRGRNRITGVSAGESASAAGIIVPRSGTT